jgi:hypothetical protein
VPHKHRNRQVIVLDQEANPLWRVTRAKAAMLVSIGLAEWIEIGKVLRDLRWKSPKASEAVLTEAAALWGQVVCRKDRNGEFSSFGEIVRRVQRTSPHRWRA